MLSLTENAVVSYTVDGTVPRPLGNDHPFVRPYGLFPCQDGFVFFGGYTDKFWRISCRALRRAGGLADDPAIDTMAKRFDGRPTRRRQARSSSGWFADRTKAELEADRRRPRSR